MKKISPNSGQTTLEPALREPVKPGDAWGPVLTDDQRAAIRAYNEHVEKDGVFSDGIRSF